MQKIYLSILFLGISLTAFTQTRSIEITWNDGVQVGADGTSKVIPGFEDTHFSYDAVNSLQYVNHWETSTNAVTGGQMTNMVYEPITIPQLLDLDPASIPDSHQFVVGISQARNKRYLYVSLSPIIKENGQIKRLVSCEISYIQNRNRQQKSNLPRSNSVLASGDFYRFYVDKTGIFKMDRNFLNALGMDVNNINPSNLKVYGNGGAMLPLRNRDNTEFDLRENSIQIVGGEDGSFDGGDYILFYGESTRQWNAESQTHVNAYDDQSYYYVTASGSAGKRVQPLDQPVAAADLSFTTFQDYQFHEEDNDNLVRLGRRWFGERFDFEPEGSFSFNFPNLVTAEPVDIRVLVAAISDSPTSFSLKLNDVDVTTLSLSAISDAVLVRDRSYSSFSAPSINPAVSVSSEEIEIQLSYNNNGNPSSQGFLDYIGLEATRELRGTGDQIAFFNRESAVNSGIGEYVIDDASSIGSVWDVTDPINISFVANPDSENTLRFKANLGNLRKYVAIDPSDFYIPLRERGNTRVTNQNLKGTIFNEGAVDYLMVTNDLLKPQAERLAQHNRTYRNLNVKVVTLREIYTEFSSGKADIGAIRNFVRYIYENASSQEERLKYLCLFGDTSFDYKDRIRNNNLMVPTFYTYASFSRGNSYMSDDYFGSLDPDEGIIENGSPAGNGGQDRLDIAVGRILADSPQLAREVVDKIILYDAPETLGRWHNNFVLVSDDVDNAWEHTELQTTIDALGDDIQEAKPFINVIKIHSDSYRQQSSAGGERYPEVNDAIKDAIEVGTLVLTYLGHGGENNLASELIFTRGNAQEVNNPGRLPLIITVTCEFTRFDSPNRPAAGEELFWNTDGGAVGLLATTREISVSLGVTFNRELAERLFAIETNEIKSVAETLRLTKNGIGNSQRRVIFFIGDPAMKLAFAEPSVRLTAINDIPLSDDSPALQALGRVKLSGEVVGPSGTVLNDFNGTVSSTLYDKYIERQTLANDGTRGANNELLILDFQALGAILYRGQASVTNGTFDLNFVVPKDASIPLGNGRLNFYAVREGTNEDRAGANEEIRVGGLNTEAPEDNEGPLIELFMNDDSFVNGGITNESPFLLVKLEDENGINTASGIGHDLTAIIDGDETNPIILNDFYESATDDFRLGEAIRKLRDLSPGLHTVTVKAWDTYNNSSTADLQFVVASEGGIILDNVLNYPNPFVDYTEFWFNHNRPLEPLDVQVQIFTVTGKVVKTINQNITTSGFLSREIVWDGRDDFGQRIGKGVYVYKITVRSALTGKQVEKTEKLVIL
ncbi:MAG: type IX secretion system sortase PorU [Leeuwenhoekiella sp.]